MADGQKDDDRSSKKAAGAAFLMGVGVGASLMAARMKREEKPKGALDRLMDQLGL